MPAALSGHVAQRTLAQGYEHATREARSLPLGLGCSYTAPRLRMTNDPDEAAATSELTFADMYRRTRAVLRRLGPGGPLALVSVTLPVIGLATLASLFNVIGPWLRAQNGAGVAIYVAGFALCAGLALFPTHILAALGGWAVGFAVGAPAACAGVLGAALVGYAVGLRATGERAVRLIAEKPKWNAVYDALIGSGFWRTLLIVLLVRLAVSPFALTNFLFAATRVNPLAYVVGTVVGLAPRTCAVVFFAVGLREVTMATPHSRVLWLIGLGLTVLAVIVIGVLANHALARVTEKPIL
jgi:uncharacterized membrane protein YdjX (TVP38/TMEM64 family)